VDPSVDRQAVASGERPTRDVAFERIDLGRGAWVDIARGWLAEADHVRDQLMASAPWRQATLWRYERWVPEPRLSAWLDPDRLAAIPPLVDAQRALQHRYGVPLMGPSLCWYRNAADSMAFHRDRDLRHCEDTIVVVLTLGARRPFLVRPVGARHVDRDQRGEADVDLSPANGDVLVMGGRCQADWMHSVPKVRHPVRDRVSVQWRWTSGRGRPEVGASYRAPRFFSR
jgi:alkylated DNA repair dioxygenase AlkB